MISWKRERREINKKILEFFFPTPRICFFCGTGTEEPGICPGCTAFLHEYRERVPQCGRCGTFLYSGAWCSTCRSFPAYYIRNYAVFPYKEPLREGITAFKYGGRNWYADFFAGLMAEEIKGYSCDCIVPVPLHPERLKERGYNQAEILAAGIAARTGGRLRRDFLVRTENTPHQTQLGKKEREANLAHAFAAGKGIADIRGSRVLLVDDVFTSGATLRSCGKVLRRAGAAEVSSVTLAAGEK